MKLKEIYKTYQIGPNSLERLLTSVHHEELEQVFLSRVVVNQIFIEIFSNLP